MKISVKLIVSLVAVLVGIIGVIAFVIPSSSGADKAVAKYISAVNRADAKTMSECTSVDYVSDQLGFDVNSIIGDLGLDDVVDEYDDALSSQHEGYDVKTALRDSSMDIYRMIPEDAKEITRVKLIGCSDESQGEVLDMEGIEVTALVEVTYIDAQDESVTIRNSESFEVVKTSKGYRITVM